MYRLFLFCCFWSALCAPASAQVELQSHPVSNLRLRWISTRADSVRLDSLSIVPGSCTINGVSDSQFRVEPSSAFLYWLQRPTADSVLIQYRIFPFRIDQLVQRNRYDSIKNRFYVAPFTGNPSGLGNDNGIGFSFGNIRADGSIGRQIGFGNAQDAVVNSSLNLQLSGMLGDSIQLEAAITDNNLPIQPDGSTQQLNEFDQVYIRFRKENWNLQLGDIDIREDRSHYLRFYKRMQGMSYQSRYQVAERERGTTLVSASIAKGKFTRQQIDPLEGNQGPYRLRGPNGEFFFVVLANTERVYSDGILLQRGEDQDYVINYNTAEISFTPKRMVTKDSRIQVEFEYAERNYLNSNLFLRQDLEFGHKWKFFLGAFNNADSRNSPINQTLDRQQQQFLSSIGDSVQNAFYSTAQLDTFAAEKILYEKIYIGLDSIYQYSTNPAVARWRLAFTDLGQGRGNYIPDFNGANGKVYKYVSPIAGVQQGRFEPIQLLVAPRRQQVMNAGASYQWNEHTLIQAEVASSNNDVNTFSSKEGGDDRGWAGRFRITDNRDIQLPKRYRSETQLEAEWVDQRFRPLERLRSIEFTRDWGLDALSFGQFIQERLLQGAWSIADAQQQEIRLRIVQYKRGRDYQGLQTSLGHRHQWRGWRFDDQFVRTTFKNSDLKGDFFRPRLDLSKTLTNFKNTRLGINYQLERNELRDRQTDTLRFNGFNFEVWTAYWRSPDYWKNRWNLQFFTRSDRLPVGGQWKKADRSLNWNLQTSLERNPHRQLFTNFTLRKLQVTDPIVSRQKEETTFLGRTEYQFNEWKGLLQGNALYEAGTGQEQRRDFSYFEVPAGQGEYAWIDYNNDGVQQLNEFERAVFSDQAKFLRIYTPTNQFVKANYSTFNYRLELSPHNFWSGEAVTGFRKFIARFGYNSSLLLNQKQIANGNPWQNPFGKPVNDTSLINQQSSWTHTLTFNRFSSIAGADLTYYRNQGKSLLTYGYESRVLAEWQSKIRWNFNRAISVQFSAKSGIQGLFTPQFANRNYEIRMQSLEPALNFIQSTKFRITTSYKFTQKKNAFFYGGEQSSSHSLNLESRLNRWQRSSVTGKMNYSAIRYPHPANTAVSFMMLDGLQPGSNWIWSLGFNKRLINNLELNIQYDGRKAGSSRVVHLGRAGVTALF